MTPHCAPDSNLVVSIDTGGEEKWGVNGKGDEEGDEWKEKEGAEKREERREDEEERVGEGVIHISLLVVGWWDKKRNDDIAVKIWKDNLAAGGELDWDPLHGRGEEEGGGLKGPVSFHLSVCLSVYSMYVYLPVLHLSASLSLPVCQTADTQSLPVSRHWHVSHTGATSLLWSYCLNDSLFSLTSAGRAHTDIRTHVHTLAVVFTLRLRTVQPWAVYSVRWSFSFRASPPDAFVFHNKELKVTLPSLWAVLSKSVTTVVWSNNSCSSNEEYMKV